MSGKHYHSIYTWFSIGEKIILIWKRSKIIFFFLYNIYPGLYGFLPLSLICEHSSVEFMRSYEPILSVIMCVHPPLCDCLGHYLPGISEIGPCSHSSEHNTRYHSFYLPNSSNVPLSRACHKAVARVQPGCCRAATLTGRPEEGRQTWHIFVW